MQAPAGPVQQPGFGVSVDLAQASNRRQAEIGGRAWTMSPEGFPEATSNRMPGPRTTQSQTLFEPSMRPSVQSQRFSMNTLKSPSPERGVSSPQSPHSSVMMSPSQANFEQHQEGFHGQIGVQAPGQANAITWAEIGQDDEVWRTSDGGWELRSQERKMCDMTMLS